MFALAILMTIGGLAQAGWQLPVTITALRDVEVANRQPLGFEVRGTLYAGRSEEAFVIRKGETFQMIAVRGEGGCRIRFNKREYELSSCPWLEGFTDHWTDIFEVVVKKE